MDVKLEKIISKKGKLSYKIGEHIEIHSHINDPESWHITIRKLKIFGEHLCGKEYGDGDIIDFVRQFLDEKRLELNDVANPFLEELNLSEIKKEAVELHKIQKKLFAKLAEWNRNKVISDGDHIKFHRELKMLTLMYELLASNLMRLSKTSKKESNGQE